MKELLRKLNEETEKTSQCGNLKGNSKGNSLRENSIGISMREINGELKRELKKGT